MVKETSTPKSYSAPRPEYQEGRDIKATDVNLEKNSVNNIFAENVTAERIAVNRLYASKVKLTHSGVGYIKGQNIEQQNCGNAFIKAQTLKTSEVKSLVTIADNIEGNVQTVLDKKGAAIFGLVVAAFFMFFRLLRRLGR